MSEALEKLRDIGIQSIHEKTHISREHVQGLLYKSYEGFNKIQFLGFVSILEREYELDLDELRQDGVKYFDDTTQEQKSIFLAPKKKKRYTVVYIIVAIVIFLSAVLYMVSQKQENIKVVKSNDEIEKATKVIQLQEQNQKIVDTNLSKDQNDTKVTFDEQNTTQEDNQTKQEIAQVAKTLTILPKSKLWFGYIDLKTHKKRQLIVRHDISLDANKEWLLSLGHGYVNIEIGDEKLSYNTKKNLRFLYKDGKLKQLSLKEFKELNEGKVW